MSLQDTFPVDDLGENRWLLGLIKKELKCADKNIILNYKAARKNSEPLVMGSSSLQLTSILDLTGNLL